MNPLRGTTPLNRGVEVSAGTDLLPSKDSTEGAVGAPLDCCCAIASDERSKAASTVKRFSDFISAPSISGWSGRTLDVKDTR
jgi:hypothetical protein